MSSQNESLLPEEDRAPAAGEGEEEKSVESSPERLPRARTLMTPLQLEGLQALWEESRFPSTKQREVLGEKIGLTSRKVQVWFQNQRSKHRRMESERLNPIAPILPQPSYPQTQYDPRAHHHPLSASASSSSPYPQHPEWQPRPPSNPSGHPYPQLPFPPPPQHSRGSSSSSSSHPRPPSYPSFYRPTNEESFAPPHVYAPPLFPSRSMEDQQHQARGVEMSRGRSSGEADRVRRPDGGSRFCNGGVHEKIEQARAGSAGSPPLLQTAGDWMPDLYRSHEARQLGSRETSKMHHDPSSPPILLPVPRSPSSPGSFHHSPIERHPSMSSNAGSDVSLPSFRDFLLASTSIQPADPSNRPQTYPPPSPTDEISSSSPSHNLKRKQPSSPFPPSLSRPPSGNNLPSGLLLPPPSSFPSSSYITPPVNPHPPPPPPSAHIYAHQQQQPPHPSPSLTSSHSSFSRGAVTNNTSGRTPSPLNEDEELPEPGGGHGEIRIVRARGGMGEDGEEALRDASPDLDLEAQRVSSGSGTASSEADGVGTNKRVAEGGRVGSEEDMELVGTVWAGMGSE